MISEQEQKKRWVNALKQAAKVNRIQKKQDIILLIDDEIVSPTGRFFLEEDRILWKDKPDSNCLWCYFINNVNLANGMELTVKQYNKLKFGNIQYCEKKHFKKLKI